jgi:hypothetical protein
MKAVRRAFHPVSLNLVLDDSRIELRIHGDGVREDTPTLLDAEEARTLANALMALADRLERVPADSA